VVRPDARIKRNLSVVLESGLFVKRTISYIVRPPTGGPPQSRRTGNQCPTLSFRPLMDGAFFG
jgi:hypothetical protein